MVDCACSCCSLLYAVQPVTDCPNHEAIQIAPMTMSSEFSYRPWRQPPTTAHRGASSGACAPASCSSSLSRPSAPGVLDSAEPRCTSQTVAIRNVTNCRYSDCQFSRTALPKSDDTT